MEKSVAVMVMPVEGRAYYFDVRVDCFLDDVKGLVGARHVVSIAGVDRFKGYDLVIFYDKSGRRKRKVVNKNMPRIVGTGVMCLIDPVTRDHVSIDRFPVKK